MLLTTSRLRLREFVADDWQALLRYQSDVRYLRYYPWDAREKADVQALVQQFVEWQHEQPRTRFQFAVTLEPDGRPVGSCGLRMPHSAANEAELGYELAPPLWGQGYATEIACAMLGFGFDDLSMHRVWAQSIEENRASIRVLEKVGMRCEGHTREPYWMKGRWWNMVIYGLLEHEWQTHRGRPQGHSSDGSTIGSERNTV
jgi:RimJ/RimL family protein N-acetyltransferase